MRKIAFLQLLILLLGTFNAWINFPRDFAAFVTEVPCVGDCNSLINVLMSLHFWGAVFFTIATILSVLMLKEDVKNNS